ncbi:MAG: penicillin-binding protein 2 [Puniceicoccales bacterium]|nr:penicillin-binding protein 2 [Puniceicoccales bacterium]
MRARFWVLLSGVVLCFCAILVRLWWLHVWDAPRRREEALQARHVYREFEASRGLVVDARGVVLATTREAWDVGVDAHVLSDKDRARAGEVASALGIGRAVVEEAFEKRFRAPELPGGKPRPVSWVRIGEDVGDAVAAKIRALGIRAVYCARRFVRDYPRGQLAAHLVGYLNRENVPMTGVERAADWFLSGHRGSLLSRRDGRRLEMPHLRLRQIDPEHGSRVELTVDSFVQEICEREAENARAEFSPLSVSIIVSEARTGRLLGLANWPTFDLRAFGRAPDAARRNRAVADFYEPGSVFKIVPVCMALNEGVVTPDDVFDCARAEVPYRGRKVSLPNDTHHLGVASVRDIVRESSNRGAALLALRVAEARGEQVFYDYARAFGFGQPTGISVAGAESAGVLHPPGSWDRLTLTRMPMGHSIAATPLQVHYAMGVVASGGRLFAPQLVRRIVSGSGDAVLVEFPDALERGRPVSPQVARTVALMLRDVCRRGGTASAADIPGYDVAGKTGTTQKYDPVTKRPVRDRHVATFSGFFPVENPFLVITVVVDEPRRGGVGYGGLVAAPVFRRLAKGIIERLRIPPVSPVAVR